MTNIRRAILATGLFLCIVSSARGTIWVNEAMVNEPSDSITLEWIEIYNDAANPEFLSFIQLQVGNDNLGQLGGTLPGKSYAIICRDSVRFVGRWFPGGVIDSVLILQKSFNLLNDSGRVQLFRLSNPESELIWTDAGPDGVSWERQSITEDTALESSDPSGSTPGRLNSLAVLPYDLALNVTEVSPVDGAAEIRFEIVNTGLNLVTSSQLSIYEFDPIASDSVGTLIESISLPDIDSGFTTLLTRRLELPGYYARLVALLSPDDRNDNNRSFIVAPGAVFPPVILSEFLPNPSGDLDAEWIELYNLSDTIIDLNSWGIADDAGEISFGEGAPFIEPGEFAVLTDDSTLFLHFYRLFDGKLYEPSGWRTLNNSGDALILIDKHDLIADRYDYTEVFDSNLTWARSGVESGGTLWGRSAEPGGTPGQPNSVLVKPEASGLSVTIEPDIFSPDDDGREDEAIISITAPDADFYTLKIYDRQGRVVKTFLDESSYLSVDGVYVWDGRSDGGGRLPIGIYILHLEAGGVESIRKILVVAR